MKSEFFGQKLRNSDASLVRASHLHKLQIELFKKAVQILNKTFFI